MSPTPPAGRPECAPSFFGLHGLWLSWLPFLLWILAWGFSAALDGPAVRWWTRWSGYPAAVALLVPFVHIARGRLTRLGSLAAAQPPHAGGGQVPRRRFGRLANRLARFPLVGQTTWLRWHIGAAFVAFVLTLFHSRGRANGLLTFGIQVAFWLVMLSGVVGYWGRIVIYRLLQVTVESEFGRANLFWKVSSRLQRRADRLIKKGYWKLTEYDVRNWYTFCRDLDNDKQGLVINKGRESGQLQSAWQRTEAYVIKAPDKVMEAARALRQALDQGGLMPGQMNALVGCLNAALGKEGFCDEADFGRLAGRTRSPWARVGFGRPPGRRPRHVARQGRQRRARADLGRPARAPNLPPEEVVRRRRLAAEASRVFAREEAWKRLETWLKEALVELTDDQRDKVAESCTQLARLWQGANWKGSKDDLRKAEDGLKILQGYEKKLHRAQPERSAIRQACRAVVTQAKESRPRDQRLRGGRLSETLIRRYRKVCYCVRKNLPDCSKKLSEAEKTLGELLREMRALGPEHENRPLDAAKETRAGELCAQVQALLRELPGEALLRDVGQARKDEVGRRNRLFLEAVSAEVIPSQPPAPVLEEFYNQEVAPYLNVAPDPDKGKLAWGWLFTRAAREPIAKNHVDAIQAAVGPDQVHIVEALMRWVNRRRQLNVEQWLDRLANCWLWVHGWAAVVLLALVIDHIVGSFLLVGH
ncbi:MAG TPA: hypothetical protein VKA46_29090 [Gemmataceae bacterium]|nr:hypothetical protein [Gemmataceae bacterium]